MARAPLLSRFVAVTGRTAAALLPPALAKVYRRECMELSARAIRRPSVVLALTAQQRVRCINPLINTLYTT